MENQQNTAQENQIPQYTPQAERVNTENRPDQPKAFGPFVGIFIIVVLLAFGGFYFWGASLQDLTIGSRTEDPEITSFEVIDTSIEEYTMTDAEFNALFNTSTETGEDTVEAVLGATLDDLSDIDALDAELDALETEL